MGKEGREKESWTDVGVSVALGCCGSCVWVLCVCVQGLWSLQCPSVCAVQVVSWLTDSFGEVSMHNPNADQSGY